MLSPNSSELHLTQQTAGNGVVTQAGFEAATGLLSWVDASSAHGTPNDIAQFNHKYDTLGNLCYRGDSLEGTFDYFYYDALSRLTIWSPTGTPSNCVPTGGRTASYDPLGNITARSDVGTYTYAASGHAHAVSLITTASGVLVNGVTNPTYQYDANGNLTLGAGRTILPTSFNMARSITEPGVSVAFLYGPEHQRLQERINGGNPTTLYLNDPASGAMEEIYQSSTGGVVTSVYRDFLQADGQIIGQHLTTTLSSGTPPPPQTLYFTLDNLGSVSVVSDDSGLAANAKHQSYDAWGKARNANGSDDPTCSLPPQSVTTRGFTNQEQIPSLCLNNYNARIYDPQIGRFMVADDIVPNVYDGQALNRYTYVGNRPLTLTDPTGHMANVTVWDDGRVDIDLPIYFQNETSNPNAVAAAVSSIEAAWTKPVGQQYNVTTTVTQMTAAEFDKASFGNEVTITDTPTPTTTENGKVYSNGGHSYVIGDFEGHWTTMDTEGTPMPEEGTSDKGVAAKKGSTFAHEAGHLMNKLDEHGVDAGRIMDDGPGTRITPDVIETIINSPNNHVRYCTTGGQCTDKKPPKTPPPLRNKTHQSDLVRR